MRKYLNRSFQKLELKMEKRVPANFVGGSFFHSFSVIHIGAYTFVFRLIQGS
ncbi:hypothetical protein Hanom_Chr01g00065061 [Helianthus anomalus]